ncbi:Digestive cysteine proteinase 1 [Tritrichomonas foetus]|uniref:Digestive cysteine proteinase 1 n=1 Tax=Tritrichomonas foetus TaxID=1144522 RepID=A0A1J4J2Y6_9EUKA|nr:Digestive cysteine proteinase 1 [Tritrichomonas foetus]|eukprot:OHS93105.1 Digestive cysteine proteinase 1 [Tritrichomonas foetus]
MLSFFVATVCSRLLLQQNEEKGFLHWMRNNNHFYTGDEYHFRLGLYLTHSRWVQEYNKQTRSFTVGVNKFSAYTPSEYRALLGYRQKPQNSKQKSGMKDIDLSKMMKKNDAVPEELDWRQKGVVNKIKDQGSCGSCWAFSAIATAESSYAHKYGTLYSLSEQNLVDCTYDAHGCSGGWPGSGLDRAIFYQQGHFNSEEDYPYEGVDGACRWNPDKPIGFVDFYVGVNVDDEEDLKTKVAILGVASVAIDAGNQPFMSYTGGIFDNPECSSIFLDHAVAAVGYGAENGVEYWIVRNSWGTDWGEEGYIRMSRNKNNQCGIAANSIVATSEPW